MNRISFLLTSFLVYAIIANAQSTYNDAGSLVRKLYEDAFASPFNDDKINALMTSLPRQENYFLVEGDILMTAEELRGYVLQRSQSAQPVSIGPELLVNIHGGQQDFYKDVDKRNLTYSVDRASFRSESQYNLVVQNMRMAGTDWQTACPDCGIQFIHLADDDVNPSTEKANFVVRSYNARGKYIATAFFPHDASLRRYLNIDPTYFTTNFDKVGLLRHELGHVLGYRHEHIQGISGCYLEKDDQWKSLTKYDPKSVMHYFCGGGGTFSLQLTNLDKAGHRKLYQIERQSSGFVVPRGRTVGLKIRFEGGNVSANVATVMGILNEMRLVTLIPWQIGQGQSVESIYAKQLGVPPHPSLTKLAESINKRSYKDGQLQIGDTLLYPDVRLKGYSFSQKLDSRFERERERLDNIGKNWGTLIEKRQVQEGTTQTTVTITGYELQVDSNDAAILDNAEYEINRLDSANILVIPLREQTKTTHYSIDHVSVYWDRYRRTPEIDWGDEGSIGALVNLNSSCPAADGANPDIVLIDTPLYHHPDLDAAIINSTESVGDNLPVPAKDTNGKQVQVTRVGSYNKSKDHGTHIAGIIASQNNSFGLIGVDPLARIYSMDWDKINTSPTTLTDEMEIRGQNDPNSIYVFASNWQIASEFYNPLSRLTRHFLSKKIVELGPLWIVAAGNATLPLDIGEYNNLAPMNLGDQKNVIVVTACNDCYGSRPSLLQEANYSTKGFVHIAAPGRDIVSTTSSGQYDLASGTSESVGFVAGVASSMLRCWKFYNNLPARIKFRLQLTATPSLIDDDVTKVTSGILDANLALKDPSKTWVKQLGGKDYTPFAPKGWCVERLRMTGDQGQRINDGEPATRDIFRIVKTGDQFWIYTQKPTGGPLDGTVKRIGPGKIQMGDKPLLLTQNGSPLKINTVEDLVFSSRLLPLNQDSRCN